MYLVFLMYLVSLVNEVTFGPHLRTGAGCLENQQLIRDLELAVPPRDPPGRGEGLRWNQSPMADFISRACVTKPP